MRRISLLTNAKANNVALKSLTEQIDAMRASINTSLDRAYQNSLIGVRDLQIQYNKAQGHLGNVPTQERAFNSSASRKSSNSYTYSCFNAAKRLLCSLPTPYPRDK